MFPICELPIESIDTVISDAVVRSQKIEKERIEQEKETLKVKEQELKERQERVTEERTEESRVSQDDSPTSTPILPTPSTATVETHPHHRPYRHKSLYSGSSGLTSDMIRKTLLLMDGENCLDAIGTKLFLSEAQMHNIAHVVNSVATTNQDAICFIYK